MGGCGTWGGREVGGGIGGRWEVGGRWHRTGPYRQTHHRRKPQAMPTVPNGTVTPCLYSPIASVRACISLLTKYPDPPFKRVALSLWTWIWVAELTVWLVSKVGFRAVGFMHKHR